VEGPALRAGLRRAGAALLAFLSLWLSRRILWFGMPQQMLHVAILLLVSQGVLMLVRMGAGAGSWGWGILAGPLLGALAWPVLSWVLLMPQRRLEREQMI
jgi:rod shape-determining protein MreD